MRLRLRRCLAAIALTAVGLYFADQAIEAADESNYSGDSAVQLFETAQFALPSALFLGSAVACCVRGGRRLGRSPLSKESGEP